MMEVKVYEADHENPVALLTLPEGEYSPFWEEIIKKGRLVFYGPVGEPYYEEEHPHLLIEEGAGRGCRCDGCAQDECSREYKISPVTGEEYCFCSFCPFRTEGIKQPFWLPKGSRVEWL